VVADELLVPLGMTRTSYLPVAPHAQGYSVDHFHEPLTAEPHQDTGALAPAGQARSTIADLARWADFLATGHETVLARETLDEVATLQAPAEGYGLGLRLMDVRGTAYAGHTGSMPGFLASLFVDRSRRDGVVALANATTGLPAESVPRLLLGEHAPPRAEPWVPTTVVPEAVTGLPGLWFWGHTALELRWHHGVLRLHQPGEVRDAYEFEVRADGTIVGTVGYHRGETMHVHRRPDGSVSHLVCATFVYTRIPYDPDVPIPGGHPA
jgi:CubicO group peptidase (beta-lactamase class C family)